MGILEFVDGNAQSPEGRDRLLMEYNWEYLGGEGFHSAHLPGKQGKYFSLGSFLGEYRILHVAYVLSDGGCCAEIIEIAQEIPENGQIARWVAGPLTDELREGLLLDLMALTMVCRQHKTWKQREEMMFAALHLALEQFNLKDDIAGQVLDTALRKTRFTPCPTTLDVRIKKDPL